MADPRPTVNFGTRYGKSAAESAKAAKDLKLGKARAAADDKAMAYRAIVKRRKNSRGYAAETQRHRLNPTTGGDMTPTGRTFRKVEY